LQRAWDTTAAEAKWEIILLEGKLSAKSVVRLKLACVTERVIAVEMHEKKMAALSSGNPRRADGERRYWDHLIKEAGEHDAKQDIGW